MVFLLYGVFLPAFFLRSSSADWSSSAHSSYLESVKLHCAVVDHHAHVFVVTFAFLVSERVQHDHLKEGRKEVKEVKGMNEGRKGKG
jgi:hypothetical protein